MYRRFESWKRKRQLEKSIALMDMVWNRDKHNRRPQRTRMDIGKLVDNTLFAAAIAVSTMYLTPKITISENSKADEFVMYSVPQSWNDEKSVEQIHEGSPRMEYERTNALLVDTHSTYDEHLRQAMQVTIQPDEGYSQALRRVELALCGSEQSDLSSRLDAVLQANGKATLEEKQRALSAGLDLGARDPDHAYAGEIVDMRAAVQHCTQPLQQEVLALESRAQTLATELEAALANNRYDAVRAATALTFYTGDK